MSAKESRPRGRDGNPREVIATASVQPPIAGMPAVRELAWISASVIKPTPSRALHTALVDCPCGYTHMFRTRNTSRLYGGRLVRRCPVDGTRYRLASVRTRKMAVRRAG